MSLTKEECLNELEILCTYADGNPRYRGEFVGKMLQEADDTLQKLINEHFELVDLLKKHGLENLSIKELDKWFDRSLWHVKKVNELSNELFKLNQVVKSKQERIKVLTTNSPLKFEELHYFMPVFDVTTGFWIMITSVINGNSFGGYVFDKKDVKLYFNLFIFEENRFYRREVNNDE